jgi:hypothetical protein
VANRDSLRENDRDSRETNPVPARLLVLAVLCAAALPPAARAKQASPQMIECHGQATKEYIEDFRRVRPEQVAVEEQGLLVVTTFQNDNPRYEDYVTECLKRKIPEETR